MKWPELRKKVEAQTAEIAADIETQQAVSMKEHLAQVEAFGKVNDSLQIESSLVANANSQRQLLEEATQSNQLFESQHADICKEKHQLR